MLCYCKYFNVIPTLSAKSFSEISIVSWSRPNLFLWNDIWSIASCFRINNNNSLLSFLYVRYLLNVCKILRHAFLLKIKFYSNNKSKLRHLYKIHIYNNYRSYKTIYILIKSRTCTGCFKYPTDFFLKQLFSGLSLQLRCS